MSKKAKKCNVLYCEYEAGSECCYLLYRPRSKLKLTPGDSKCKGNCSNDEDSESRGYARSFSGSSGKGGVGGGGLGKW